jgi:predicted secreted protein
MHKESSMPRLTLVALSVLFAARFFVATAAAHEAEEPLYDRVSLSASAQMEVPNDRLRADLSAQFEGEDAARLAAEVNRAVDWALGQAREEKAVEVKTLDYRTHPLYRQQTLSGWRVRQGIRLTSTDATALSHLVGRLQKRLAVDAVAYELSPEARSEAENQLIQQAIAAFQDRARRISGGFGREQYRLVQVDIQSGGQVPQPMFRASVAMEADMATAPRIEAGSQTVQVTVSGTIELLVH